MVADAHFGQEVGQFFRHTLGQGGHQAPLALFYPQFDLLQQVVNLPFRGLHFDGRIQQPGGTDYLLNYGRTVFHLVGARGRGNEDDLVDVALKLPEVQWPVVQGRRQAKSVVHQGLLAGNVAMVHAPYLGQGHVGLVNQQQVVIGEVVQ